VNGNKGEANGNKGEANGNKGEANGNKGEANGNNGEANGKKKEKDKEPEPEPEQTNEPSDGKLQLRLKDPSLLASNLMKDPIVLVNALPKKPKSDLSIPDAETFHAEFGISETNIHAVNGETVHQLFVHPEIGMNFILPYLYTVTDGKLVKGDVLLPEQAIFLIVFHHLFFVGILQGLPLPSFQESFTSKYEAVKKLLPTNVTDLIINIPPKNMDKYIEKLRKDFPSNRIQTWASLFDLLTGEPSAILDVFRTAVEAYDGKGVGESVAGNSIELGETIPGKEDGETIPNN
jgi:hypothetical protein